MIAEAELRRYADLLVEGCLYVGKGDRLRIVGEPCLRPFMLIAAEAAYNRGARTVRLEYNDAALRRLTADRIADEWLDDASVLVGRTADAYVEEGWASLNLMGEEAPRALEGADPARLGRLNLAGAAARKNLWSATLNNRLAWCVAPLPTAAWARAIFDAAGRDGGPDPEAALWAELVPILGLDADDPAAAARDHARVLDERAVALTGLKLEGLRFRGPGTELAIGLAPGGRWLGGSSRRPDGRPFLANHPTEEVYTTPDARLTAGRVRCTRPVAVLGQKVEGAWFEFAGGVVVGYGAAAGAAALERYLASDAGAKRLGEVALVDALGAIFKSGLVFDNGLIDENAACHIALGAGFEEVFSGPEGMDEAAKAEVGFNDSQVHCDFMIGSPEVDVFGLDSGGGEIPLLVGGRFRI
jgi:aminopeptidase